MLAITEANRRWWTLVGACAGLFLLMLDSTVVALALPAVQRDLGASSAELQWVMNGYLLITAVLVVTLGRLGDMFGRRRVFLAGLLVFAAGSCLSALAPAPLALIAGRVLQGTGGAALLTLSLAIVSDAFPAAEQSRAFGIWAGVSAVALGIGPLVGGVLIDDLSWRWIFWINLPLVAAGAVITLRAARESRDETAGHRIDWPGLVTLSVGLIGLVLGLVQAKSWGWVSVATLGSLGAGAAGLVAFWLIEHRVAQPIVEFPLFRNGPYFGASAAAFALVGAYWGVMFFQPQYLQDVLGHSAVLAGVLILPVTVPMILISPLAGRLIARFGARSLMTAGMAVGVAGLVLQTRITAASGYGRLLPGLALFGVSLGLVYAPMSSAAMAAMPRAKAGIAAGVLAMDRIMAGALGLALVGALFQHLERDRLDQLLATSAAALPGSDRGELTGLLAGSDSAQAALRRLPEPTAAQIEHAVRETFTYALSRSLWILVAVAAIGTALTWAFVRSTDAAQTEPGGTPSRPGVALRHLLHHRRFHL